MLKLLHSIFHGWDKQESYPEALVAEAIERAVDGTDPQLRGVSGYKKKLRPAVVRAIDHVVALVDGLPSPLPLRLSAYGADPRIKSFFISIEDMRHILEGDRSLAQFIQGPAGNSDQVIALMAIEKQERHTFGAGLSGDIVVRDVPQVTVSFDAHRFLDPTDNETETRHLLMRRAYDHLLTLALRKLSEVKWERSDLERRRSLLQAKVNLLQREGWGFDQGEGAERVDIPTMEKRLGEIESQLQEIGGDYGGLDENLQLVIDVLGRPEQYLRARSETICVDRMGIKHAEPAQDAPELELSELENAEGRTLVVTLVSLQGEELRSTSLAAGPTL